MLRSLVLIVLALGGGLCFWAATKTDQIKRKPLQKSGTPLKAPASYEKRERVQSGKQVTYDPKPRVKVVDEKTGNRALVYGDQKLARSDYLRV